MLSILLHQLPVNRFATYEEAITYLATNTVVFYGGLPYRPNGFGQPSYDISQVYCWLSEQPLRNGMRLCTINNNNSSRVAIIEEPLSDEQGVLNVEIKLPVLDGTSLLLISPDCHEALRKSLDYLNEAQGAQQLIKDPQSNANSGDPLNSNNYIWPTRDYGPYTSQHCFIYTRKSALVQQLVFEDVAPNDDDTDDAMVLEIARPLLIEEQALKEFILVEANPALPGNLFIMAENTIRLFGLNSRFYDHFNPLNFHCINYNASMGEDEYDDMRLEGRMQAYDRAAKSLHQLKNIQNLAVDQTTTQIFISQYKTLMELTGYTSVWATVFNDGNDPGSFNDIMGTPAPVIPVTPTSTDNNNLKRVRSEIAEVSNTVKIRNIIALTVERVIKKRMFYNEVVNINYKRLNENEIAAANNKDFWEQRPAKRQKKTSLPGQAKDNGALASNLVDGVFTCRDEVRVEVTNMLNQENIFCNPQYIF